MLDLLIKLYIYYVYIYIIVITVFKKVEVFSYIFSSVQLLSHVQIFVTPWTQAHQASLSFLKPWSLLKLKSIELVMPSNQYVLCYPPLLLSSMFPSIRVFSDEFVLLVRWPKYWSFNFIISSFNEYSELIFFRID